MKQVNQREVQAAEQLLAAAVWAKKPSDRTEEENRLLEKVAKAKKRWERTDAENRLLDDVDGPWHD